MPPKIILASGSQIRQTLLRQGNVPFEVDKARVDESSIRASLESEGLAPRDIADALAEAKARKVSARHPEALVVGCDQVLSLEGQIFSKPETPEDARAHIEALAGKRHELLSAAVIYEGARPVWRHVAVAKLMMRQPSAAYLDGYIARNWDRIQHSVGGYLIEEEGVRLFQRVDGDYFHVLGMPLLELLSYLTLRGVIDG